MAEPQAATRETPLEAGATVVFHDSHRPILPDGRYHVECEQYLVEGTERHPFRAPPLSFTVSGPRFRLDPAEIHSVYPPTGASGNFAWTLPHVVLTRATLPWERSAAGRGRDDRTAPPWLAVLLFEVEELARRYDHVITVEEYFAPSASVHRPEIDLSPDLAGAPVHVLDLPLATLMRALPDAVMLSLLAHVRTVAPGAGSGALPTETAIVVSGRPVQAGRQYEAHLVSLEGWLGPNDWLPPDDEAVVRVVSLHSWRFDADGQTSFEDEARALSAGLLRRELPADGVGADELAAGWLPLRHERRDGGRGTACYRSPLSPREPTDGQALASQGRLPARRADELLGKTPQSGQLDVSFAAAWELGRLLSLQNPAAGLRLHQWWRHCCHHRLRRGAQAASEHLAHLHPALAEPELGAAFDGWLDGEIWNLGAVPYRYLIPDDAMLPKESLRLFSVDRDWLACLADGVFSVAGSSHLNVDVKMLRTLKARALGDTVPERHGLLLRSRLLADYPGVQIDASGDGGPCTLLRRTLLAPGILLALYDRPLQRVVLHLPPQVMHFEVHEEDRGLTSPERCLDFHAILAGPPRAGALAAALDDGRGGPQEEPRSGRLALRMLGTMPKAVFAEQGS